MCHRCRLAWVLSLGCWFLQAAPVTAAVRECFDGHVPRWLQPGWQILEADLAELAPLCLERMDLAVRTANGTTATAAEIDWQLPTHSQGGLRAFGRALWQAVVVDETNEDAAEDESLAFTFGDETVTNIAAAPHWNKVPSSSQLADEFLAYRADSPPEPPAEFVFELEAEDSAAEAESHAAEDFNEDEEDHQIITAVDEGAGIRAFGRAIVVGLHVAFD